MRVWELGCLVEPLAAERSVASKFKATKRLAYGPQVATRVGFVTCEDSVEYVRLTCTRGLSPNKARAAAPPPIPGLKCLVFLVPVLWLLDGKGHGQAVTGLALFMWVHLWTS